MRIGVCIKQVPATQDAKMDYEKGTLIRSGMPMVINPYDLHAIETALRIQEQQGAEVVAFTMGPVGAQAVLREALSMGVNNGVLVSDRAFAGADTLATSYTLAQAITEEGDIKLIVCGRQTTDGDTAQVGPAIAAQLGLPCLCWVNRLVEVDEDSITVVQSITQGEAIAKMSLPGVICVDKEIGSPRIPGLKAKIDAKKREIKTVAINNLPDKAPEHYGLGGSPTRVKIFSPECKATGVIVDKDAQQTADFLFNQLVLILGQRFGDGI